MLLALFIGIGLVLIGAIVPGWMGLGIIVLGGILIAHVLHK